MVGIDLLGCARYRWCMITHIKFVNVPVEEQDRALLFYTEKLGFTIITDQPFDEKQRWIELRIPKAETRLVLFSPDGQGVKAGGFFNAVFECDDVFATHKELVTKGVEFVKPPFKEHWGSFAMFKDSEGNQIGLSSK